MNSIQQQPLISRFISVLVTLSSDHMNLMIVLYADILVGITRINVAPRLGFCSPVCLKKVKQRNIIDKYLTKNVNNEGINIQTLE